MSSGKIAVYLQIKVCDCENISGKKKKMECEL